MQKRQCLRLNLALLVMKPPFGAALLMYVGGVENKGYSFTRKLRVTISKSISSTIIGAGILVVMLSVGCMLTLFPILFISAAFDVGFDVLFVWLGAPFSILFAVSWFYRYADFTKLIISRRW